MHKQGLIQQVDGTHTDRRPGPLDLALSANPLNRSWLQFVKASRRAIRAEASTFAQLFPGRRRSRQLRGLAESLFAPGP